MKAKEFSLPDQNGKVHKLSDYKGKWVVMYFYPKDNTPGCTKQACSFRDNLSRLEDEDIVVLGVSKDSEKSHKNFDEKYKLGFTLLSDESTETINAYGAWQEKSMFGKKYMGIQRMTVIIDPEGEIVKEYPKVKPADHAELILKDIKELKSQDE